MFFSFRVRKKTLVFACLLLVLAAGGFVMIQQAFTPVGCSMEDIAPTTERVLPVDKASPLPDNSSKDKPDETPEAEEKIVYLTFDDGPSSTTEKVLDILNQESVPATFFVIAAENNEEYLPLLSRTVSEGHMIALHTCSHEYRSIYANPEAYWEDVEKLKEKINPYVQTEEIAWLRFPGGSTNTVSHKYGGSSIMKTLKEQAVERGYTYVDWNICANDAVGGHPSAEKIYNNVVRNVDKKSVCVVLMHDTKATKATADALPQIIQWFKNAGYRFDTIDHLTGQI